MVTSTLRLYTPDLDIYSKWSSRLFYKESFCSQHEIYAAGRLSFPTACTLLQDFSLEIRWPPLSPSIFPRKANWLVSKFLSLFWLRTICMPIFYVHLLVSAWLFWSPIHRQVDRLHRCSLSLRPSLRPWSLWIDPQRRALVKDSR